MKKFLPTKGEKEKAPRPKDEKPPSLKKRFARLISKDGMTKGDRVRLAQEQEAPAETVESKPEPKTPEQAKLEDVEVTTTSTAEINESETADIEEENRTPENVHASMQYTSPKVHERVQVFNEQLQAAAEGSPRTKVVTSPEAETSALSTSSAIAAIIEEEEPDTTPDKVAPAPAGVSGTLQQIAAVVSSKDTPTKGELPSVTEEKSDESLEEPQAPREPSEPTEHSSDEPASVTIAAEQSIVDSPAAPVTESQLEQPLLSSITKETYSRVTLLGSRDEQEVNDETFQCTCCGCFSLL